MRNIALSISYDGTNYCGWQRQKNGPTVQEEMEKAIAKVSKEKITVEGCGRTDAGVHALDYTLNFKTNCLIPTDKIPVALNSLLPDDISVKSAREEQEDFHSRFSAKRKTYIYKIYQSEAGDPFRKNYAWHMTYPLDFEKMEKAAEYIVGTHDFKCFMATGGNVKTTVRTVEKLLVKKNGDEVEIEVTANGFLYNMVRIITGTLIYVGVGKLTVEDVKQIIENGNRTMAGITAPPHGLYMKKVEY